jgi:subtilisin family serine protease
VLATHEEFEGRADCGYSAVPREECTDGNGHGTHVSGTIGGKTYGVAKEIRIVGVKVLGNEGSGSNSGVIDGVNYVLLEKRKNPNKIFVVNMSLGGGISPALDDAVEQLIDAGAFAAVAAGNSDINACLGSPSRVRKAMTVASSDQNDERSDFSNWGKIMHALF